MKNIYTRLTELHEPSVLATVTYASGSTPQKPGSSAIFDSDGLIAGTVGGGSTEGRVTEIARGAVKTKKSGHYFFRFDNELAVTEDGPICGGEEYILVDADPSVHSVVFNKIRTSLGNRIPGVLVTKITGENEPVNITRYWMDSGDASELQVAFRDKISKEVSDILKQHKQGDYREITFYDPGRVLFLLEAVFPQPSLVIAGAGHIGRALAHLGSLLDFEVTVIDDRPEYANSTNIPEASNIIVDNIGKAMREIRKGEDTYIVIVTRGHKDDRSALQECIGSDAAYIGAIGSRTKIEQVRENFLQSGKATQEQWNRIYAPIGLPIGSQSVEEIAVSIAAQLVQVRNRKKHG